MQKLDCGNAHRFDATRGEDRIAPQVTFRIDTHIVRSAVDLDRETCCFAEEVENVRLSWVLSAELEAAWPLAKFAP